ncbi:MAG: lysophospholipid acyltransferase family protein [Leptolyngbyaceae cyanobacterium bins.349]|nr:lysophospholipid acyltransferase family protein [Leptolyngbyaceae cyanobacterium bins.349]
MFSRPGWSLKPRNPIITRSLMLLWGWLYHSYFRVETSGWQHIPPHGQVMLVGSHNGGLAAPDMFMMMYDWFQRFGLERPAYGLMHPAVWKVAPAIAEIAAQVGAIPAHPKMAIAALQQEASILVYPGGARDVFRPHALRHKICLGGNQGFVKLALEFEVPIIPLISHGAHDTFWVLDDLYPLVQWLHQGGMPWLFDVDPEVFPIYLGLPWGVGIGPIPHLPLPVKLYTQVCAPVIFERYGRVAARDRDYVNHCYNQVCTAMQQAMNDLAYTVEQP